MSERILLVRMSSLGDVIHATPVARGLKRVMPDCHLTWFVREACAPVLEGNPYLDDQIVVPSRMGVSDCLKIWWRLKAGDYTIAIDLEGILKGAGVTYVTGAPRRIGSAGAPPVPKFAYTEECPSLDERDYISQRYLADCDALGVDLSDYRPEMFLREDELREAAETLAECGLDGPEPVIATVVFSRDPKCEWPDDSLVEFGDIMARELGARIFIPGTEAERPRAAAIAGRMRHPATVVAGRTTFRQAVALLKRADLVVGVDTGLTHAAYAVDAPVVSLIGRTESWYGPKGPRARTLRVPGLDCRPCSRHDTCDDPTCMTGITPRMAADAALELAEAIGLT